MLKNIYIHIGNFKTGSTSLQRFLYLNRNNLKSHNLQMIYEKKNFFKGTINNMKLFQYFDKFQEQKIIKYLKLNNKNKKNYILTSEYFSCFADNSDKINFLHKTFLKLGFNPIIIFYRRNDISYLYSFYAELLKHRKTIEIDNVFNFVKKIKNYGHYKNIKNNNYYLSQKYFLNNRIIIKNFKKIFKKKFFVIEYKNTNNQIFKDFLKIIKYRNSNVLIFPKKLNKSRKIKFWNLKRIFYFLFLSFAQKYILKL